MFTGIVEDIGRVAEVTTDETGKTFCFQSDLSHSLKINQSVAHDGICLTVTKSSATHHWVTAIDETLNKSTIGLLKEGSVVHLERSMLNNGRFDGHIVQGHVDQVGKCESVVNDKGQFILHFSYNLSLGNILVNKGSIAIDGVSLTCFDVHDDRFAVAVIPYTIAHTHFTRLSIGSKVNLEFDIIGKYVQQSLKNTHH